MLEEFKEYTHEEIRLELFYQIKQLGFFLTAERPTNKSAGYHQITVIKNNKKKTYTRAKFGYYDLGVHKTANQEPFFLIEIKKKESDTGLRCNQRQQKRYDVANIPWDYCNGIQDIPRILEKIKGLVNLKIEPSKPLSIYTDGSCDQPSGRGGWAYVAIEGDSKIIEKKHGKEFNTTSNRMELIGAIMALKEINHQDIVFFSDSKYLVDGMNKWIGKWVRKNWMRSKKQPVKNKELWQDLLDLTKGRKVRWEWVEGHSGNVFNEIADELARYDF